MSRNEAQWSVLLYINADSNGLEDDALTTFRDIAEIGSSPTLNIVAQFDRRERPSNAEAWRGARRFFITQSLPPVASSALPAFGGIVNSGDGRSLAEFVDWAMEAYPARQTMLVIWGHGSGYSQFRGLSAPRASTLQRPSSAEAATIDDTAEDPLYVREAQDALLQTLRGKKLDIIGLDSCLMGMLEVAYAMRDVARVLIASEELEPGASWSYSWLQAMQQGAPLDAESVARMVIEANAEPPRLDTLAAFRLDKVGAVTEALDEFVETALAAGDDAREAIITAREQCGTFGGRATYGICHSIDLKQFLKRVLTASAPLIVKTAAKALWETVDQLIFASHISESVRCTLKAEGLGIYYPLTLELMQDDRYRPSYQGIRRNQAVQLSRDHRWLEFLHWAVPSAEERTAKGYELTV
jgi:hypothetical protein